MIDKKCFTKEWLLSFKKQKKYKSIQIEVLEKMIRALHLLELLKIHGLDFVFKGGTCLILLLDKANRFSVDIDIICDDDRLIIEEILDKIVKESIFKSVSLQEKRSYKKGVPKAHYVFDFESVCNPNVVGKLLLDILFEKKMYPELISTEINTEWIQTTNPIKVITPSIDAITGDKLTAFAPNTVGIPYYKDEISCATEICKQLFDLGELFPNISSVEIVNESFQIFANVGIDYRNTDATFKKKKITNELILKDIIATCLLITKREQNKEEPFKTQFVDIERGIRAFGANFLMTEKFRIENAISASAKVAHLAIKLFVEDLSPIIYYEEQNINTLLIEDKQWIFLNKLKRQSDKSSFYYWYQSIQILNKKG